MKVRYYIDLDIPEEVSKDWSEQMDVTIYGNRVVEDMLRSADSCDDLPLCQIFLNEDDTKTSY